MKPYLLIPSAKVVEPEMRSLGEIPPIIYPLNGELVFDYLYRKYKNHCDKVIISCHEKKERVHAKLDQYVPNGVNIIDLDDIDTLGDTIFQSLIEEDIPVIINFGDTIVLDEGEEEDSFFYSEDFFSSKWTYFDEKDGELVTIVDKQSHLNSKIVGKFFVGVFYLSNSKLFKECIEKAKRQSIETNSTFFTALLYYSQIKSLKPIRAIEWLDIGHIDKYFNSKIEVKSREFNHISIDKSRGILTKYSDEKEKFIGEIKWYLKLPSDVEYVCPRIFKYSLDYNNPFVSMEYYAYHTIHELFLFGDLNYNQWTNIFERILFICNDFKRYTIKDSRIKESLEDMYLVKNMHRIEKIRHNSKFEKFFESPILINGIKYKSLSDVTEVLKCIIPEMLYDVDTFNVIHGDLCFSNMMIDSNYSFVKLIDPRGKFGKFDIYGDERYELAKLFHSVDGKYDYIIKDLFDISYDEEKLKLDFSIHDKDREFDLYSIMLDVFADDIGDDLRKIELIEALLFLSMIPLHGENINHQLVMLGTGLEILDRVVDIREK